MQARPTVLALSLAFAACAPATEGTPDAGGTTNQKIYDISGKVMLHPLEVTWRTANGSLDAAPSLGGVTVHIEDAVQAKAGLPPLKTVTAAADGTFVATDVDVKVVTIAILASVEGNGLYFSGYGLQRGRPSADLVDMPVYVFSEQFIETFAAMLSADPVSLKETGFALGVIRDVDETPLAGASIAKTSDPGRPFDGDDTIGVLYPNDDLTGLRETKTTGSQGVVVLTNAGDAKDYTAILAGKTFEERLTGSRGASVVSFFIHAKAD